MNEVNTIDSDWKYDIICATLIQQGGDKDNIFIQRIGESKRGVAKEIENIITQQSNTGAHHIHIKINKASIYDSLPEGIFHSSLYPGHNKNKNQVINEIRHHRNEEFFIRRFFRFFEEEIDTCLIDIQLLELQFDQPESYKNFTQIFTPYWSILKELPLKKAKLFINFIPHLHKIRESINRINHVISSILDENIIIKPIYKTKVPSNNNATLCKIRLNRKSVISGNFQDGNIDFSLTIKGIHAPKIHQFLPEGKERAILDYLCNLLLPAYSEVDVKIEVIEEEKYLHLAENKTLYPSYIEINSYLRE